MCLSASELRLKNKIKHDSGHDIGKEVLLSNTMSVLRALMECSDEIQQGVLEMAEILIDPNIDEETRAAAEDTLIESLYPKYSEDDDLGIDSDHYEAIQKELGPEAEAALDAEEETFASRVADLMQEKDISQVQLAEIVGVGQPAISMMLTRKCRPQRSTVMKIANALDVSIESLWPN